MLLLYWCLICCQLCGKVFHAQWQNSFICNSTTQGCKIKFFVVLWSHTTSDCPISPRHRWVTGNRPPLWPATPLPCEAAATLSHLLVALIVHCFHHHMEILQPTTSLALQHTHTHTYTHTHTFAPSLIFSASLYRLLVYRTEPDFRSVQLTHSGSVIPPCWAFSRRPWNL